MHKVRKEAIRKGIPSMLANKNHVMRLSLVFALVAVCAVVSVFAGHGSVSAASPKGPKIVAYQVARRPVGPNNVTPKVTPRGIGPNANTSGCDADASDAGCNQDAGIALPLTGTLNSLVGDAAVNGGSGVNLAIGGQSVNFTFPTTIVDTRGGAVQWALSATSAGIPLNPAGVGATGSLNGAITFTGVTGACTVTTAPAGCTLGAGTVNALTSTPTLNGTTGTTFATAPTGGDFGSTIVTASGAIAIPANVLGGSYSGTITVTATPAIPV